VVELFGEGAQEEAQYQRLGQIAADQLAKVLGIEFSCPSIVLKEAQAFNSGAAFKSASNTDSPADFWVLTEA
jgi:hypothetical protein